MTDHLTSTVRPFKAGKIMEYRRQYTVSDSEMEATVVTDAVILPLRRCEDSVFSYGHGGIVTAGGNHVECADSTELVGGGYEPSVLPEMEQKKVVYCGYFQMQWGHFLMQSCNRLWYALDDRENVDEYIFAIDEGAEIPDISGSNYEGLFSLLGIAGKVRIVNTPTRFREVIVPQESFAITRFVRSGFASLFSTLRERALAGGDAAPSGPKKVLLGRSAFAKAAEMEMGLRDMEHHFSDNGYAVISPENVSIANLIRMMDSAEEIVTFSGSAAHNIVFAPRGAKITVIDRYPYVNYFQTAIDLAFGFDVTYVDANAFVRPVAVGLGPFIYTPNKYFDAYCSRRGLDFMAPPSDSECRKTVRRFMRIFRKEYGRRYDMPSYLLEHKPDMRDALSDSRRHYDERIHCPLWYRIALSLTPAILARDLYRTAKRLLRR